MPLLTSPSGIHFLEILSDIFPKAPWSNILLDLETCELSESVFPSPDFELHASSISNTLLFGIGSLLKQHGIHSPVGCFDPLIYLGYVIPLKSYVCSSLSGQDSHIFLATLLATHHFWGHVKLNVSFDPYDKLPLKLFSDDFDFAFSNSSSV